MTDELHLQAGLLRGHGLQIELLRTENLNLRLSQFLLFLNKGIGEKLYVLLPVNQLGAVLADLSLDDILNQINGLIHVSAGFLCPDNGSLYRDGYLDLLQILLCGERDVANCLRLEEFIKLTELLVNHVSQAVGYVDVSTSDIKLH